MKRITALAAIPGWRIRDLRRAFDHPARVDHRGAIGDIEPSGGERGCHAIGKLRVEQQAAVYGIGDQRIRALVLFPEA